MGSTWTSCCRNSPSSARTERMAKVMLDSTSRIFELIGAVKDYFVDGSGADSGSGHSAVAWRRRLTMLQSRLEKVKVERRYAAELPRISAYASKLNQVWMSLLENALDAMHDEGEMTLYGACFRGIFGHRNLGQRTGDSG